MTGNQDYSHMIRRMEEAREEKNARKRGFRWVYTDHGYAKVAIDRQGRALGGTREPSPFRKAMKRIFG
jgi:hypothetical protein